MPGPFGQLGSAPVTPVSGPTPIPVQTGQPIPPYQMPTTAPAGSFMGQFHPSVEAVRSQNLTEFRHAVLNSMGQGQDVGAAVMGVLNSSIGAAAMNDPDFPTNNKDFIELISPQPEAVVKKSEMSQTSFDALTPVEKARFHNVDDDPLPERILIIDQIMKENNPERLELLQRLIPRDASGKISVMDAMRIRTAGKRVNPELSFEGINDFSPEDATKVLRAGLDERSATDNDLVQATIEPEDTPERQQARLSLAVKVTMKARAMDGLMALIASRDDRIAGKIQQLNPQTLDELWDIVDGKAPTGKGKQQFQVPVAGQGASQGAGEAKPGGVVAGPASTALGSDAGKAQGPRLDVDGVLDAIHALTPEEMKALKEKLAAEQKKK